VPTSDVHNLTPILREILRINPQTVLDLGIGMGKYGALAREFLDVMNGRVQPAQWQAKIIGVEGFVEYMNPMWDLYTKVYVEDFRRTYQAYRKYDLVLMIDSLEHVDKAEGTEILNFLRTNNRYVLVSCPDGDYPQGAWGGNELERHRAVWLYKDFVNLGATMIHRSVCSVGVFKQ
jgi:hypothetical protein